VQQTSFHSPLAWRQAAWIKAARLIDSAWQEHRTSTLSQSVQRHRSPRSARCHKAGRAFADKLLRDSCYALLQHGKK
jgi:hypothetical protein